MEWTVYYVYCILFWWKVQVILLGNTLRVVSGDHWHLRPSRAFLVGNLIFWWNSDLFIPLHFGSKSFHFQDIFNLKVHAMLVQYTYLHFGNWRFGSKVIHFQGIFILKVHAMLVQHAFLQFEGSCHEYLWMMS